MWFWRKGSYLASRRRISFPLPEEGPPRTIGCLRGLTTVVLISVRPPLVHFAAMRSLPFPASVMLTETWWPPPMLIVPEPGVETELEPLPCWRNVSNLDTTRFRWRS